MSGSAADAPAKLASLGEGSGTGLVSVIRKKARRHWSLVRELSNSFPGPISKGKILGARLVSSLKQVVKNQTHIVISPIFVVSSKGFPPKDKADAAADAALMSSKKGLAPSSEENEKSFSSKGFVL